MIKEEETYEPNHIATIKHPLQSVIVFVFLPVKEKKKITFLLDNNIKQ